MNTHESRKRWIMWTTPMGMIIPTVREPEIFTSSNVGRISYVYNIYIWFELAPYNNVTFIMYIHIWISTYCLHIIHCSCFWCLRYNDGLPFTFPGGGPWRSHLFFIEVTAKWMVSTMNSPAILVNVKGGLAQTHCNDPLVMTNIAMENGPCIADQDDLPINYCDFPWLC